MLIKIGYLDFILKECDEEEMDRADALVMSNYEKQEILLRKDLKNKLKIEMLLSEIVLLLANHYKLGIYLSKPLSEDFDLLYTRFILTILYNNDWFLKYLNDLLNSEKISITDKILFIMNREFNYEEYPEKHRKINEKNGLVMFGAEENILIAQRSNNWLKIDTIIHELTHLFFYMGNYEYPREEDFCNIFAIILTGFIKDNFDLIRYIKHDLFKKEENLKDKISVDLKVGIE